MFARALGGLAGMLSSGDTLPSASAGRMTVLPGIRKAILRRRESNGSPSPLLERGWCSGDTLYIDFRLGSVADWPPASPRIEVLHEGRVVAWDDDPVVELHLRSRHKYPARWQLLWSGAVADSSYQVRMSGGPLSVPIRCRKEPG